jgi:hypothetical protein
MVVRQEQYFNRPSEYSEWHRTLSNKCLTMDCDWIEVREGRGIVAFIETAIKPDEIKLCDLIDRKQKFQTKILLDIQAKMKVPAYLVFHKRDLSTFWIFTILSTGQTYLWKTIGKKEYAEFIEHLGEVIV